MSKSTESTESTAEKLRKDILRAPPPGPPPVRVAPPPSSVPIVYRSFLLIAQHLVRGGDIRKLFFADASLGFLSGWYLSANFRYARLICDSLAPLDTPRAA